MSTDDIDIGTPDSILPSGEEGYNHGKGDVSMLTGDGEAERIRAMDPGIRESDGLRFRLLHDLVAIRPDPALQKSHGGIYIPDQAKQVVHNTGELIKESEQHHTGTVLGIGPGRRIVKQDGSTLAAGGRRHDMDLKVGDRVCYHRASSSGLVWHDGGIAVLVHSDGGDDIGDAVVGRIDPSRS